MWIKSKDINKRNKLFLKKKKIYFKRVLLSNPLFLPELHISVRAGLILQASCAGSQG